MSGTVSAARFAEVVAERDDLAEQVRALKAMMVEDASFPSEWKIGPKLAILFRHFLAREMVTRDTVMTLYYGDRLDPPGENIASIWVMKLRRKLQPLGFTITNVYGYGWFLSPEDKQAIRAATSSPEKTNPEAL